MPVVVVVVVATAVCRPIATTTTRLDAHSRPCDPRAPGPGKKSDTREAYPNLAESPTAHQSQCTCLSLVRIHRRMRVGAKHSVHALIPRIPALSHPPADRRLLVSSALGGFAFAVAYGTCGVEVALSFWWYICNLHPPATAQMYANSTAWTVYIQQWSLPPARVPCVPPNFPGTRARAGVRPTFPKAVPSLVRRARAFATEMLRCRPMNEPHPNEDHASMSWTMFLQRFCLWETSLALLSSEVNFDNRLHCTSTMPTE